MSRRTLTMLITFVVFTVVMAGLGWVLQQTVPPFIDWAAAHIGIEWVAVVMLLGFAAVALYVYRATRAGRSERSLTD